jgi:hypothetical protein
MAAVLVGVNDAWPMQQKPSDACGSSRQNRTYKQQAECWVLREGKVMDKVMYKVMDQYH